MPRPLEGTPLPGPGATLRVLRRYPDGVVALWDELNGQVLFLQLQEVFCLDWQPSPSVGGRGTS